MVEPLCRYFGVCGGCSLQDVDYPRQLDEKSRSVSKAAGIKDVPVFHGFPYRYRSRMDFVFHPKGIGFRCRGGWRDVFDVEECPISNEGINVLLHEMREFFRDVDSFDGETRKGTFRYAVIRAPEGDSSVSFVLNEESSVVPDAVSRIAEFASVSSAKNIAIAYLPPQNNDSLSQKFTTVKGGEFLVEHFLGKSFRYPIQGFFQNNPSVALLMQEYVRKKLEGHDTSDAHLLDLYGGVGTFGIVCADLFRSVTILESDNTSICAAAMNIRDNSAPNVSAMALDAKRLGEVELPKPLFVITDPPRGGMHPKTVKRLNEAGPQRIIYVSCNLKQLSVDVSRLKDYELVNAAFFDMFPQTPHCEAIAEFAPIK